MRHGDKINNLGRKVNNRRSLLKNLAKGLVANKRIFTTLAKAKALRVYLEPLITKSKDNTTHSRRIVFGYLQQKESVTELFEVIAPKVMDRPGGYLRIIRTGYRLGDSADTAMIEFVDFNDVYVKPTADSGEAKKKTLRGRGGKKPTTETTETTATEAATEE